MAAVTIVCFGLTADSTAAKWAELITIILNVAAYLLNFTHNKHWDKYSSFLCLREKQGVEGGEQIMFSFFNNKKKLISCMVIYCTFRVTIRPIIQRSPRMTLKCSANNSITFSEKKAKGCNSMTNADEMSSTHRLKLCEIPTFYRSCTYKKVINISAG